MNIDFATLRRIIKDKTSKTKNAIDSPVCLNEFLNVIENLFDTNRKFKQDESSNFIMSFQNWLIRRSFTTYKDRIRIGDIFYADLGINYKPEFSYHHPVIILEDVDNMLMVVPVSSTDANIKAAYHPIDNPNGSKYMRKVYGKDKGDSSDGFEKTGAVLLSDVKTISKGRLIDKKGSMVDINNPNSVFREIKTSVFKFCFPKESIKFDKLSAEFLKLQSKYDELLKECSTIEQEVACTKEQ